MTDFSLDLANLVEAPGSPPVIVAVGSTDDPHLTPPHQHSRGQLSGSTRGLLSVRVEDAIWIVPAIHAVWLPPHTIHSAGSRGPFSGWSAYIAAEACADLPDRPCTMRTSGLLREAILRAGDWPLGPLDDARARLAAVIIDEIRGLPIEPLGLPLPHTASLQRIARALADDPSDERSLESWAQWAGVSARTLSRRFVLETGLNFTNWRQRARLMRSLELLATGVAVTTIALDLGYATPSAFISVFRRTFGETPSAYRRHL